jgi:uncharacterized protein
VEAGGRPTTDTSEDSSALLAALRADVGATGARQVARHPVNEAMIAHWCDAMGDDNPCYTDAGYARTSVHGGLVAPPAMLDVWDRAGLRSVRTEDDPRARVIQTLDAHGYVSTVAVNSELEFRRYLRPGELIGNVQVLEDVSAEKQTALGLGHFVTTRHEYTTDTGELVGTLRFRILKFRPGTGRRPAAAGGGAGTGAASTGKSDGAASGRPAPDPDPARRPEPARTRDNAYFWDGARRHELRVQQCANCGRRYFPATPRCWECGSFDMGHVVAPGTGHLYSFVVVHHPQVNGFRYPLPVGLVELDGGTRLVAELTGCDPSALRIGMPLELTWLDRAPSDRAAGNGDGAARGAGSAGDAGPVPLPRFRPAPSARRTETATVGELTAGAELPVWALPMTPTLIVAGALATRDFTEVHHDRDIAHQRGSADIFPNINTSVGLMERYVTDALGPQLLIRALRVRLGAQAHPYDTLTFTGRLERLDPVTGLATVAVRGRTGLGDHVTGTVEAVLPGGSEYRTSAAGGSR